MDIRFVHESRLPPDRFKEALTSERYDEFASAVTTARKLLEGRVVFNINSTARGGGVAEMLRSLLAYARGGDIDARWLVIPGDPSFFTITKRLHNHLHGMAGDGGPLGSGEEEVYRSGSLRSARELTELVQDKDVVIVHDPQPAALVAPLKETGATVIWRCHVGLDKPNDVARRAWDFLQPHIERADAYVFSREAFVWPGLDRSKIHVIPPSIDAFSPKNQDLSSDAVEAILASAHVTDAELTSEPLFLREDGTSAKVEHRTRWIDDDGPVPSSARFIVQVSRWDRLKDPAGVIDGFARFIAPDGDVHLVVAGPDVQAVADDPEGADVLAECVELRAALSPDVRRRVHLASLPMEDGGENAAIVNALQRRAEVVVQKSIAEGFGLTVAEGMWKARPVVATRIGGIQDQVIHGETGLLIDDPHDLEAYGKAVSLLLNDPQGAERMGALARERVRDEFLGARHLMQYLDLLDGLLCARG